MTAAAKTRNGSTTSDVAFPVDSFREAAVHLRKPFTPQAVKFKVQTTFGGEPPTGGMIVAYIDARLVVERLNHVCPHLWFDEYQALEGGKLMCRLTVDEISRRDIGEGYAGKGLYSDALKRAAVKFGVGVSLYAVPKIFLKSKDGHLKPVGRQGKQSLVLTDDGEGRCRELYRAWLDATGSTQFGQPIDHGDIEDSVGDVDVPAVEPDAPAETTAGWSEDPVYLSVEEIGRMTSRFRDAGIDDAGVLTFLAAVGAPSMQQVTREQAWQVRELLDKHLERTGGAS